VSSTYLSAWVIASLAGRDKAAEVLQSVAPVGDPTWVDNTFAVVDPFLVPVGSN